MGREWREMDRNRVESLTRLLLDCASSNGFSKGEVSCSCRLLLLFFESEWLVVSRTTCVPHSSQISIRSSLCSHYYR